MKTRLKQAGKSLLIIAVIAAIFLGFQSVLAADFGTEAVNNGLDGTLATGDPRTIVGRIINFALGFLGVIAVGIILWSGFNFMTANGDEEKVEKAKKILKAGVIGLVIVLSSWAIAIFILNKLGGAGGGSATNGGCSDGATRSCGCGGYMVCNGGSWSSCIGSNPDDCAAGVPTSCDAGAFSGCQANDQICAPGYFCDDSCLCQKKGEAGDSCDADVSNQQCDADDDRCSEYLTCDPATCVCAGPPVITGLSPQGGFCENEPSMACAEDGDCASGTCNLSAANGAAGNLLTITGKNFGQYVEGESQVVFVGTNTSLSGLSPETVNPLCVGFWYDEQIVVVVPSGVQSGAVKVVGQGGLSDSTADDYGPALPDFVSNSIKRPGLCYLNPEEGGLSSEVSYSGVNLRSAAAYFGNYEDNVSALYSDFSALDGLSGKSVTPNIRSGETGSFVEVANAGVNQKSNYLKFIKSSDAESGPYILSFSPASGNIGQYVTIDGSGFGGAQDDSRVYFVSGSDKIEASYAFPAVCGHSVWSNNQVIVKVPEGIGDGNYILEIAKGEDSITTRDLNPSYFSVDRQASLKTSLCKVDPDKGNAGTSVRFWGEYFGQAGANGLVRFSFNQDVNGLIKEEGQALVIDAAVPAGALTGPVKIVKNGEWGNELNFLVGECQANSDCTGNQVCCPANTFKEGRCATSLEACFIDVPSSVFQWRFSTDINYASEDVFNSCSGFSKYAGACSLGSMCPNSPGACSSPSASYQQKVGECDRSCADIPGCTAATCSYNSVLDRCVLNSSVGACDLSQNVSVNIAGLTEAEAFCNQDRRWEISVPTSCPSGWTRLDGNRCVKDNATCQLCAANLSCQNIGGSGRCVSDELCSGAAGCFDNSLAGAKDDCLLETEPACECCCRIGQDSQDCCAGLTCAGNCGSDLINDSDTYGRCSGCAAAGDTALERDAACNCSGHSGQYCSISSEHPEGVCTDCSGINDQETCGDHSNTCCFDSNKTADPSDDFCRGLSAGDSVLPVAKGAADYGYCSYFECFKATASSPDYSGIPLGNPALCSELTPVKVGYFSNLERCVAGCAAGLGSDRCHSFDGNSAACFEEDGCCYDAGSNACISGNEIESGASAGYCAYYNCQDASGDPQQCSLTATTTKTAYTDFDSCSAGCAAAPSGQGDICGLEPSCSFETCNSTGFACLKDTGSSATAVGGDSSECGTCCCQPGSADYACAAISPNLHCLADQGACSGASRGLCCGCSQDSDCGSLATAGCGNDTCCQARPEVLSTNPAPSASNVCRNASVSVIFNQKMDSLSLGGNFLLFEEKPAGSTCPEGSSLAAADISQEIMAYQNKGFLARLWNNISSGFRRFLGIGNETAIAAPPSDSKIYCSVAGSISSESTDSQTTLVFTPNRILSAGANYYAVVKGDELLNSQSGVLSAVGIGMNGSGLHESDIIYNYRDVKFNGKYYSRSYSFRFTTLSSQGASAGICNLDYAVITPASYLFNLLDDSIEEDDSNAAAPTFDKVADKDKLYSVKAYNSSGQLLHPVSGYSWDWDWSVEDSQILSLVQSPGLDDSQRLVEALAGTSDGESQVAAVVNMDAYRRENGCQNCNSLFAGDGLQAVADAYVFTCANPWPPVSSNGSWSPWKDASNNCTVGDTACGNFNYKFYYCRDAGEAGTFDDLPAVSASPLTRSQSSQLVCSSDQSACSSAGSLCGLDINGDGAKDGLCYWDVLKESYFFRELILSGATISAATDTGAGGEIRLAWNSAANSVKGYKIYYSPVGKGATQIKEISAGNACTINGSAYSCNVVIGGLADGQAYSFRVTVISNNNTESALSEAKNATPSDTVPPAKPNGFSIKADSAKLHFSWLANSDDAVYYRVSHGLQSGKYGEYFDSSAGSLSLKIPSTTFGAGDHYFALSALDAYRNEGARTNELGLYIDTSDKTRTLYWYKAGNISETPVGRECAVKLGTDAASGVVNCQADPFANPNIYTRLYVGKIAYDSNTPFCSTSQCPSMVNADKCRWSLGDLSWSYQCYIKE